MLSPVRGHLDKYQQQMDRIQLHWHLWRRGSSQNYIDNYPVYETLIQCKINTGRASKKVDQHYPDISSTSLLGRCSLLVFAVIKSERHFISLHTNCTHFSNDHSHVISGPASLVLIQDSPLTVSRNARFVVLRLGAIPSRKSISLLDCVRLIIL